MSSAISPRLGAVRRGVQGWTRSRRLKLSGIVLLSPALASAEVVFQLVDASPDRFGHTFASINEHGQVAFRRNQGSSNASILA